MNDGKSLIEKLGLCDFSVAYGSHAKHLLISRRFKVFCPMAPTSLASGMPMIAGMFGIRFQVLFRHIFLRILFQIFCRLGRFRYTALHLDQLPIFSTSMWVIMMFHSPRNSSVNSQDKVPSSGSSSMAGGLGQPPPQRLHSSCLSPYIF